MNHPQPTVRTWCIFGASSPIARAYARIAAQEGHQVILIGRDAEDLEISAQDLQQRFQANATFIVQDLEDCAQHPALVEKIAAQAEHPLSCFLAFAQMPDPQDAQTHPELVMHTLQLNAVATIHLIECLRPILEAENDNHIVVVGSVAGDRGRRNHPVYSASKACIHAYLEGMRMQFERKSIYLLTVKPGYIDTRMTFNKNKPPLLARPQDCAMACWQAAKYHKRTIYFPWFWRLIMFAVRHLPEPILARLPI